MVAAISFRTLRSHELAELDSLLALYESALPAHEQKPHAWLRQMFAQPGYAFVHAERDEQTVGFAILYRFQCVPLTLLEYLAVAEHERQSGLGSRLFSLGAWLAGERTLLVELDAPHAGAPETVRRHRFYRRQDCQRVGTLDYVLPLPDLSPPPMWLLMHGRQGSVERDELAGWLRALYTEVYGRDASDPRIDLMLRALPR